MRWIRLCSAVLATVGLAATAQAGGLFGGGCGSGKSCGCASSCQPTCCRPTLQIPCEPNTYTYQRQHSCAKPPCCSTCEAPTCCAPSCGKSCGSGKCGLFGKCGGSKGLFGCFGGKSCSKSSCSTCNTCEAPACTTCQAQTCSTGCAQPVCQTACEVKCCNADPCEIARLIYESQTACYAKDRRKAVDQLGDKFDCLCNPEIMSALIYALNDADERVRAEAAEEIGDQLEKNSCCCSPEVISALSCALGDCDAKVVKKAKGALELCGYDVVDSCCPKACGSKCSSCSKGGLFGFCSKKSCKSTKTCTTCAATTCSTCNTGCANGSCAPATAVEGGIPAAPAPAHDAVPAMPGEVAPAPAPAPPADPQAFRPGTTIHYSQPVPVQRAPRKSLANLLGLAD